MLYNYYKFLEEEEIMANEMIKTTLFEKHVGLNAKMVDFGGFNLPIQYAGITEEHHQVRTNAGIFDVSHMGEVIIEGERAIDYIQHIFTNDISAMKEFQVMYGLMCYKNGTVVDDLLVYKYNDNKFLLVVNASNKEKDFEWLKQNNKFNVAIKDISKISEIAIQGPNAENILQQMTDYDLTKIEFFNFQEIKVLGEDCIVSRTGYTGEDGFEVYSQNVLNIWDKFIELGASPIGLGARDTLRFEAALPLYGNEISDQINPIEANLGIFVKLDKDFIGRDSLVKIKENRKLKSVGIELIDKGIPRHGYKVLNENDQVIGEITTGYKLKEAAIALALIPVKYKIGDTLYVQIRNKKIKASVVSRKFMNKNYKK